MTNDLREMQQRMTTWMNEKPSFNSGDELRLNRDDLMIFQFAGNGDENGRLLAVYRSHIIPQRGKNGKPYNAQRYCPIKSGENMECPFCAQGMDDIKERMSMWFYVHHILHAQMPAEKHFPQVEYAGRYYFDEEVMGWRRWDSSAWRESPWNDIVNLAQMYQGLHNFTAQMQVTGEGLSRRFKIYPIPNSPALPPELYQQALDTLETIPEYLHKQLTSPVQAAPTGQQQQQPAGNNMVVPFSPVVSTPFNNSAAPAAPTVFTPVAPAATPPPPLATFPPAPPAPAAETPLVSPGPVMTPTAPAPAPVPAQPSPPAENNRPMRSLF